LSGIVLSLCDRTGVMVSPWAKAGYECWIVDMQHQGHPGVAGGGWWSNVHVVGADVRRWLPPLRTYAMVFAFPPCTDQAVSGARWFKDKGLAGLAGAVELVERCRDICEWTGAPSFFSFSSLRWWGSPQTSTWTWRLINQLPVVRKDLTRVDDQRHGVPNRSCTAPDNWLRVNVRAERATK
jgi:hypothetical protein